MQKLLMRIIVFGLSCLTCVATPSNGRLRVSTQQYIKAGRAKRSPLRPSRRNAIRAISAIIGAPQASLALGTSDLVKALKQSDTDWPTTSSLEEKLRPPLLMLPRSRIDRDFAVLLMRTSYSVADELDFIPMDDFQKRMFLFRQKEWTAYKDKAGLNIESQGDLANANYFDFMSFVQYATISDGMRNGKRIFNELIDSNGTTRVVNRADAIPASSMSNEALPSIHADRVGERILEWFAEKSAEAPKAPGSPSDVVDGVRQLSNLFQQKGYMLTSTVDPLIENGNQVGILWTLVAPATLWSSQVLDLRGDTPVNDFAAKTALAYLRKVGLPATCTTRVIKGTTLVHEIRWPKGFSLTSFFLS